MNENEIIRLITFIDDVLDIADLFGYRYDCMFAGDACIAIQFENKRTFARHVVRASYIEIFDTNADTRTLARVMCDKAFALTEGELNSYSFIEE